MLRLTDEHLKAIKASTGPEGSETRITCDANLAKRTVAEDNFLRHIQRYKYGPTRRLYPSWQEVLALLKALGWQEPKEV